MSRRKDRRWADVVVLWSTVMTLISPSRRPSALSGLVESLSSVSAEPSKSEYLVLSGDETCSTTLADASPESESGRPICVQLDKQRSPRAFFFISSVVVFVYLLSSFYGHDWIKCIPSSIIVVPFCFSAFGLFPPSISPSFFFLFSRCVARQTGSPAELVVGPCPCHDYYTVL